MKSNGHPIYCDCSTCRAEGKFTAPTRGKVLLRFARVKLAHPDIVSRAAHHCQSVFERYADAMEAKVAALEADLADCEEQLRLSGEQVVALQDAESEALADLAWMEVSLPHRIVPVRRCETCGKHQGSKVRPSQRCDCPDPNNQNQK